MVSSNYRFTEKHEWVKLEKDVATVGISAYAVDELGEIVFVDLPEIGAEYEQMAEFGSVESVKTVSSLSLPISGVILEINKELLTTPDLINNSAYEEGWLVKVKISDEKEVEDLMTYDEYQLHLEAL